MALRVASTPVERRDNGRQLLYTTLPVQMALGHSGESLPCRIDDVSSAGLGVLTSRRLESGAILIFSTLNGSYRFSVAWSRDEGGREFRSGLRLETPGVTLESLFSQMIAAQKTS